MASSGAKSSDYAIARPNLDDEGSYSCKVSGEGGEATSNSETLTVLNNLVIGLSADKTAYDIGDEVTLTANVTSSNGNVTYTW